ncbi:MAG: hypothetical protein JXA13_01260 [Anaerolineales bacterium]|nr:hypothetical protein [Anaerolineales bacterium]
MAKHRQFQIVLFLFACILFLGCSSAGMSLSTPTAASAPTRTPRPSATPRPTLPPTETLPPPSPTPIPAGLGETVSFGDLDMTVLYAVTHDRIVPGGMYYYVPNEGYMVVDVIVRLETTSSNPVEVAWNDFYIINELEEVFNTSFAGSGRFGKTEKVDVFTQVDYDEIAPGDVLEIIDRYAYYCKVIFVISDDSEQTILFGIDASPQFKLLIKK